MKRDQRTYIDAILFWTYPALTAAERVLQDEAKFNPWSNDLDQAGLGDRGRSAESAMMLLALRNVERAASWAIKDLAEDLGEDVAEVMAAFHGYLPGLVSARDALEHFDEYAVGKGRLQRMTPTPFTFEFVSDPRPVVLVGPIHIDVEQAREACRWLVVNLLSRFETPQSASKDRDPPD